MKKLSPPFRNRPKYNKEIKDKYSASDNLLKLVDALTKMKIDNKKKQFNSKAMVSAEGEIIEY
jgi:hypothetical protein